MNNNNNSNKRMIEINTERRKKANISDLYLKKYEMKFNKGLLNSKLSEASLSKKEFLEFNSDKADTYNNLNLNINYNINNNLINNK